MVPVLYLENTEECKKILQDKLNHEVPYVYCFNHQLQEDFFNVCNSHYIFFRKPTVAAQYTSEKLKKLLDQRWTKHLATVSVIVKSGDSITEMLCEIESTHSYSTDVKLEATSLLKAVTKPSFRFIAYMSHKILGLLNPPIKWLHSEAADL